MLSSWWEKPNLLEAALQNERCRKYWGETKTGQVIVHRGEEIICATVQCILLVNCWSVCHQVVQRQLMAPAFLLQRYCKDFPVL